MFQEKEEEEKEEEKKEEGKLQMTSSPKLLAQAR